MKNLFKKTENNYPAIVQQIHNEMNTAGEKALEEALAVISQENGKVTEKGKRLEAIGFSNVPEVKESKESEKKIIENREVADLVKEYSIKYPLNKFILEKDVKSICEKYSLVCGGINLFKGFVPEKNLKEIEAFQNQYEFDRLALLTSYNIYEEEQIIDLSKHKLTKSKGGDYVLRLNGLTDFIQVGENYDGINFFGSINVDGEILSGRIQIIGLQICAPAKDMNLDDMTIEEGYKVRQNIPDPVVLQPVKGGYLIITAWGDEASDPIVVNSINQ